MELPRRSRHPWIAVCSALLAAEINIHYAYPLLLPPAARRSRLCRRSYPCRPIADPQGIHTRRGKRFEIGIEHQPGVIDFIASSTVLARHLDTASKLAG